MSNSQCLSLLSTASCVTEMLISSAISKPLDYDKSAFLGHRRRKGRETKKSCGKYVFIFCQHDLKLNDVVREDCNGSLSA